MLIIPTLAFSQSYKGKILDDNLIEVSDVTVFYPGTTISTLSDKSGNFEIPINRTQKELIFSHPEFNTYVLDLSNYNENSYIKVALTPKIQLSELVVNALSKDERAFFMEIFKQELLSVSKNGKACKIKNEDAIRFNYNKGNKVLKVYAKEPLVIDNKRLGYKLLYTLENFEYDLNQHMLAYAGYVLFKDKYKRERRRIKRRREEAYNGSLQHLFSSFYSDTFEQEGFSVRKLIKKRNPNYPSDSLIEEARLNVRSLKGTIVLDYNSPNSEDMKILQLSHRLPKYIDYLVKTPLKTKDFLTKENGKSYLNFEDYLSVVYTKEEEPKEYCPSGINRIKCHNVQTSLLWITGKTEILPTGVHSPANNLWTANYLAFEKLGDLLPADYVRSQEK